PLSSEDYKFIMQYRDAKPKTEVLKELRKKYPMTNDRFYRIWRRQENLSIPKSHLPNIDQASIVENSNASASSRATSFQLKAHVINGVDTVNKLTKKVGGGDGMYVIIECERREAEEAERESERFLNLN
ncbi:9106_t:CDS:2, partial [Diversispora eburnea]